MKHRKRLILLVWFGISLISFLGAGFFVLQFKLIKTTGFYFQGPDFNEIDLIEANGFDKSKSVVQKVYCLQHNRQSENYIIKPWRADAVYYALIDSLSLKIPLSLIPKIEKVWFKYGNNVSTYSVDDFTNEWHTVQCDTFLCFSPPNSLIFDNTAVDAFLFLMYSERSFCRIARIIGVVNLFLFTLCLIYLLFVLKKKYNFYFFKNRTLIPPFLKKYFRTLMVLFAGFFFAMVLLEISIRIFGAIHSTKYSDKVNEIKPTGKNVVLCVGDSYTESFGSTKGNDYPSQLKNLLNKENTVDWQVINLGRSGKNTRQILLEMPSYLEKYQPAYIVLMAGSANYWNYWGYEGKSFFEELAVVKFSKLIFHSIKTKNKKNVFDPHEYLMRRTHFINQLQILPVESPRFINALITHETPSSYVDSLYRNNLISEDECINTFIFAKLTNRPEIFETSISKFKPCSIRGKFYMFLSGLFDKGADSDLKKLSPYMMSVYYFINEMQNENFSEKQIKECITLNPYFEEPYFQYYTMGHKDINVPDDFDSKRFSLFDSIHYYMSLFGLDLNENGINYSYIIENTERRLMNSEIDNWVREDIDAIISLCEKKNTNIILMTYPILYNSILFYSVNNILRETASRYNLKFIDNELLFNRISGDKKAYFISDGHCNDKGYFMIASQVTTVIEKETKY